MNGKLTQWLASARRGYVDLPDGQKVLIKQEYFIQQVDEIAVGMLLSFDVENLGGVSTAVNIRPYRASDLSLRPEDMLTERLGVFGEIIAWDMKSKSGKVWVESCQTEVDFERSAWQSSGLPQLKQRVLLQAQYVPQQEQAGRWQAQWLRDPEQMEAPQHRVPFIWYGAIVLLVIALLALAYLW